MKRVLTAGFLTVLLLFAVSCGKDPKPDADTVPATTENTVTQQPTDTDPVTEETQPVEPSKDADPSVTWTEFY